MIENDDALWEKIAGKIHGELNSEEEAEFNLMITEDKQLSVYEKTQKIHDNLANHGQSSIEGKVNSWIKVEQVIRRYQLSWIKTALKYAAIIVFAFVTGNLLKPVPNESEIHYSEISVPYGQMSQINLSDGTKIWLNSGTTLRYPEQFAQKSRVVYIEGEAFFEVAKMVHKPFTVCTSGLKIEVLGTSFNLSAYKEDVTTQVTLVEGKVAVQDNTGKTIAQLIPGQIAIKNNTGSGIELRNVETAFYKAWIEGKIYFDDEPFDQIAIKLERWFNVEITFANQQVKSRRFTGTILRNKPVDQIMQALELLAPFSFKHQVNATGKDKIIIYNRT